MVQTVFLSYARQDYFFAEMLAIKLGENGFKIWRDAGAIRAGDDWRQSIERGISESVAVIVAVSASSVNSAYVTYEWAYAFGMGKPVIAVKLSDCNLHPKLEPSQFIDFSYARALPWKDLIDRLNDVDEEEKPQIPASVGTSALSPQNEQLKQAVLDYLTARGYTMASFERLIDNLDPKPTVDMLRELTSTHSAIFRMARLKGNKPGIAKRIP